MLHVTHAKPAASILWRRLLALHYDQLLSALVSKAWASPLRCVGSVGPCSMAAGKQVPPFGRNDKALENGISGPIELRRMDGRGPPLERGRIWQPRFYDFV